MKKMLLSVFLVAVSFLVVSCSNDDGATIEFRALRISNAELPESFTLNGRYQITVTYERPNGCTYFEKFDVPKIDTTAREVIAIGYTLIDQPCTQEVTEMQESFLFEVLYDQPYLFRFWQGNDADGEPIFLEIEVPVN